MKRVPCEKDRNSQRQEKTRSDQPLLGLGQLNFRGGFAFGAFGHAKRYRTRPFWAKQFPGKARLLRSLRLFSHQASRPHAAGKISNRPARAKIKPDWPPSEVQKPPPARSGPILQVPRLR